MQKKNRQVLFVYKRTVSDKDSIVDRKETISLSFPLVGNLSLFANKNDSEQVGMTGGCFLIYIPRCLQRGDSFYISLEPANP
jgi:hypothetical protein